jgi:hypothetical protein
MPLIYSFVARDTTVLAEYTAYTGELGGSCQVWMLFRVSTAVLLLVAGNFNTLAIQCLQNLHNPDKYVKGRSCKT